MLGESFETFSTRDAFGTAPICGVITTESFDNPEIFADKNILSLYSARIVFVVIGIITVVKILLALKLSF